MPIAKVNHATYARALKLLLEDPITAHEIAEETGLHIITAKVLMRTLKAHKVVHVCAWEPDSLGRDAIQVYKLGPGKDKPRKKISIAERGRRYRLRKQQRAQLAAMNAVFAPVQEMSNA